MAIILSIETSTTVCSAAIHDEGKLMAGAEVHLEYSHASKLAKLIDEVKALADVKTKQIEAVASSSGPGSYTGLRIGTSLAKGLCYALNIPLITINTLELLAYKVRSSNISDSFFCPMIDARRMEVYCQVFESSLQPIEPIAAKIIDEQSFENYLDIKPVIFFGNGAEKCRTIIRHHNAIFLNGINPSATELGELAFPMFKKGHTDDLIHFVPLYLKEFLIKKPLLNLNETK
jgi:tRNA threonylcarbamoyladenosine biosynthesis protein TsaB